MLLSHYPKSESAYQLTKKSGSVPSTGSSTIAEMGTNDFKLAVRMGIFCPETALAEHESGL